MKKVNTKHFFYDFPDISTAVWQEKIGEDLKSSDNGKELIWNTDEGIQVKPFYRTEDLDNLEYLSLAGSLKPQGSTPNGWTVCQDIFPGIDPVEANSRVKSALHGGAQAIRIQLANSPTPGRDFFQKLFDGVSLENTEILFQGTQGSDALYDQLLELALDRGENPLYLSGSLGADPLGKMATTGVPVSGFDNLGRLVLRAKDSSPGFRVIDMNGALFQNAGSTLVEELAFSLAMGNEYLANLTSRGVEPADAFKTLQLSMAAGSNYFMEIAKLRAARILWGTICEGYGVDPVSGRISLHSTSADWNLTLYDPHVNMLRGTTGAMSSILGGADLVTVLPFDYPYGISTAFSDRIARSVQVILRDEAYFGNVADPSSGAYYIESLTDAIAEKSWDLFRETEKRGGFRKAFESGWVQQEVMASKQKKLDKAASGKLRLIGTNAYPDFNEMILHQAQAEERSTTTGSILKPLIPFRAASMFEQVRLQTERNGKRPRVFLLKHGDQALRNARALFSGNLFACAGYEIIEPPAFDSVPTAIEEARKTAADVIVLCSSDDAYPSLAQTVHEALKEQSVIVVAGLPGDHAGELKRSGIEHFIHMNSNLLETLQRFNTLLSGDKT